ncbi:hypothetical protein ACHAL6_14970 [Proteiniclasticum sp. C24MP]|uniref:hypothetical protein n=1 Tax=Proteiniclasticum sp. C24MP TaxID=3374101 RepID=UPI003754BB38
MKTRRFVVDASAFRRGGVSLKPEMLTLEELLAHKRTSLPLSAEISAVDDEHILAFYYVHGFDRCIYRISEELLVLSEMQENELHLYDVLSTKPYNLENVMESILPEHAERVVCHFAPKEKLKGLHVEDDPEAGWMIRPSRRMTLPEKFSFPDISKA